MCISKEEIHKKELKWMNCLQWLVYSSRQVFKEIAWYIINYINFRDYFRYYLILSAWYGPGCILHFMFVRGQPFGVHEIIGIRNTQCTSFKKYSLLRPNPNKTSNWRVGNHYRFWTSLKERMTVLELPLPLFYDVRADLFVHPRAPGTGQFFHNFSVQTSRNWASPHHSSCGFQSGEIFHDVTMYRSVSGH